VTARSLNIPVEDYDIGSGSEAYTGVKSFMLEDTSLMDAVYRGEKVYLNEDNFPNLHVHQILVFKGATYNKSLLAVFKGYDKPIKRLSNIDDMEFSGIAPLNKEQGFAYELLTTDEISCITIAGKAGTGKSMVALSYALHYLGRSSGKAKDAKKGPPKYERIMILKPIVPLGRDVGFLPGTLEEKLGPWTESFFDSLDFIFQEQEFTKDDIKFKDKPYQHLIDRGMIEFLPLTFMRGRSLPNTLIILDEAQNTSVHEIKTLLTRTGEGSKVICLGDIDQIDAPWLDKQNNGLAYLIERGKNADMIGHVTFIKSHRSDLANWASDNL
jgi:PhoH-like ATPase